MIDGFTMFNNYHIAAKEFAAGNLETYGRLMMIINTYALEGFIIDDLNPVEKLFLTTIKASLDKSIEMRLRGQKGGRPKNNPGFNLEKKGLNLGFNEEEKEEELEFEIEFEKEEELEIVKNTIIKCAEDNGVSINSSFLSKSFLQKIKNSFKDIPAAAAERINYVLEKYPNKDNEGKAALYIKSFSWETIPAAEEKKQKKTKKPNLDFYKTAPKTCNRCGSKIVKWAGVPKTVICENCKTYWEFDEGAANEWKCSRGD